jgi:AAA domain
MSETIPTPLALPPPPPRYIREMRFGQPKTWKSGSILGSVAKKIPSYPQPLLHINLDPGGWEICPDIKPEAVFRFKDWLEKCAKKPMAEQLPITVLDLSFRPSLALDDDYSPTNDPITLREVQNTFNQLALGPAKNEPGKWCPYKTVVLDPITELSNAILRHQKNTSPGFLSDPRKWAGNAGKKLEQIIEFACGLPCNVVFIGHTETVTIEEPVKKFYEQPMLYSNLRNYIGGKFTQYFYQMAYSGKFVIRVKPFDLVSGLGCRWPDFGNNEISEPHFTAIYGKEPLVYK